MQWQIGSVVGKEVHREAVDALLLSMVFLGSCSWWARLDRVDSRQEFVQRHSLLDSGGWRLDVATLGLEWRAADQRVVIFPSGPFRFHVDSGFLGEADVLMVEGRQKQVVYDIAIREEEEVAVIRKDSLLMAAETSSILHHETEAESGWKLPWWVWVVLLVVVGMFVVRVLKKFGRK